MCLLQSLIYGLLYSLSSIGSLRMSKTTIVLTAIAVGGAYMYFSKRGALRPLPEGVHTVIVGGGYGGVSVANALNDRCKVTLIDSKDAFHHNIGATRAAIQEGFAQQTLFPYMDKFGGSFVRAKVVGINTAENYVILDNGENVAYSHLVLATGSCAPFPGKLPLGTSTSEALTKYNHLIDQVKKAQEIVIVGGGAVGVEMAGEIGDDFKDKKVTVIHPHDYLVKPGLKDSFQQGLRDQLQALGVNFILGERVLDLDTFPTDYSPEKLTVTTDKGSKIQADLVIRCTGLSPNTQLLRESMGQYMDEKGLLQVNKYLQVEGLDNVFALGDITNNGKNKLAMKATFEAKSVSNNITNLVNDKSMEKAAGDMPMMVLSIGREGGIIQAGPFVIGPWLAKRMKGKDMLLWLAKDIMKIK